MNHLPCITMLFALKVNLDFATIAGYYGMMCLVCLPVSLATMVYIYRKKPEIVDKFNRGVDNLFNDKEAKTGDPQKEENQARPYDKMSTEERNEVDGIPNLCLFVGDRYKCVMTEKDRKDIGGTDMSWHLTNAFIGDIKNGIFSARKAGKAYIESNAIRKAIYYVTVKPVGKDWRFKDIVNDVLESNDIANVKVRNATLKIDNLLPEKGLLVYDFPDGKISYESRPDGSVRRALYETIDNEDTRKSFSEGILEYMEPIQTKQENNPDRKYWFHKGDEDAGACVDYIAFMRKSFSGKLLLGIGECWRYGASEDEIALNALMTDRSFAALLSPEDIPERIGDTLNAEPTDEEINGRAEIEAANSTLKEMQPSDKEDAQEEISDEGGVDLLEGGPDEFQEGAPDPFASFDEEDYESSDDNLGNIENE